MQTAWKLEPVYMYVNTENQEHNNGTCTENLQANLQPITNSNNENIDGVPANEDAVSHKILHVTPLKMRSLWLRTMLTILQVPTCHLHPHLLFRRSVTTHPFMEGESSQPQTVK